MKYFHTLSHCNLKKRTTKHSIGSLLALVAAFVLPELPNSIHPVAVFGKLMQRLEDNIYPHEENADPVKDKIYLATEETHSDRSKPLGDWRKTARSYEKVAALAGMMQVGCLHVTGHVRDPAKNTSHLDYPSHGSLKYLGIAYNLVGTLSSAALGYLIDNISSLGGTVLSLEVAAGPNALYKIASEISHELENGDIDQARKKVGALVSRDTASLQADDILRASIESVAENTVDAITAPLLYAIIGGPAGVLTYRAINTLDAMVGYRNNRYGEFGWFSARLDDIANWLPARITVIAVALTRPLMSIDIIRQANLQGSKHPSPNAGRVEAAFAYTLGIKLGGVNSYHGKTMERPVVGGGNEPNELDVDRVIRLSRIASIISAFLIIVGVAALSCLRSCRHNEDYRDTNDRF